LLLGLDLALGELGSLSFPILSPAVSSARTVGSSSTALVSSTPMAVFMTELLRATMGWFLAFDIAVQMRAMTAFSTSGPPHFQSFAFACRTLPSFT